MIFSFLTILYRIYPSTNSGSKRSRVIRIPELIARRRIRAREPVRFHEKKVTVIIATFCKAKITTTAPSKIPRMKRIIIKI
jgi:hypothetical protein